MKAQSYWTVIAATTLTLLFSPEVIGQPVSDDTWQPSFVTNATAALEGPRQHEAIASDAGSQANITEHPADIAAFISDQATELVSREGTGSAIKIAIALGALSLAPALILMTTCYVRLIVVLTLLRQAFGAQQLPPNQVVTALALFMTLLIMTPVWKEIKANAIDPYASAQSIDWEEAIDNGLGPIKRFMGRQINAAGNTESIAVFYRYLPDASETVPNEIDDVPINVLLPAFLVSELKVAFLLGFQIFLPFLVIDLVVSTVTVSMGMLMLPPTMVSLPLKLIMFVMVDGWNLVVGMLLQSFGPLA